MDTFAHDQERRRSEHLHREGALQARRVGARRNQDRALPPRGQARLEGQRLPPELAVIDEPLEEYTAEKLAIPVASDDAPPVAFEVKKGTVKLADQTELLPNADPNAKPMARLPKGGVFNEVARGGQVSVIQWDARPRRLRAPRRREGRARARRPARSERDHWLAPCASRRRSAERRPQAGGVVTDGDRFTLSAVITSPVLLDAYVLVNDQKVFFRASDPEPTRAR